MVSFSYLDAAGNELFSDSTGDLTGPLLGMVGINECLGSMYRTASKGGYRFADVETIKVDGNPFTVSEIFKNARDNPRKTQIGVISIEILDTEKGLQIIRQAFPDPTA